MRTGAKESAQETETQVLCVSKYRLSHAFDA